MGQHREEGCSDIFLGRIYSWVLTFLEGSRKKWSLCQLKPVLYRFYKYISAVFTIARRWKQHRRPSTDECIKKLLYIYTMEYYSAIKRNAFEPILMRQMNQELIIQSEVSQKEKNKYINTYIWNLERWYWWNYLQSSKGDADIENRLLDTVGKGEEGMNWKSNTETYTLPCVKQIASGNMLYDTGTQIQSSVTT